MILVEFDFRFCYASKDGFFSIVIISVFFEIFNSSDAIINLFIFLDSVCFRMN